MLFHFSTAMINMILSRLLKIEDEWKLGPTRIEAFQGHQEKKQLPNEKSYPESTSIIVI